MMLRKILAALVLSVSAASFADAAPLTAVTLNSVNLRAGPSTDFPVVVAMPQAAPLVLYGCIANYEWCDVSWGAERGWVAATYIKVRLAGGTIAITPYTASSARVVVVPFNEAYWTRHYVRRPWFRPWREVSRSIDCGGGVCTRTREVRGLFGTRVRTRTFHY